QLRSSSASRWHRVVQRPGAGFQQCAASFRRSQGQGSARGGARGVRDGVVVKVQAKVQVETRRNRPLISGKPCELVLVNVEGGRRAELDPFKCRTCRANNFYRKELLTPVIRTMRKIEADLQLMVAIKMLWVELGNSLPLESAGVTILPIEEATFRGFNQQPIGFLTVRKRVRIKLFISESRGKQGARLGNVAVLCGNLITTLV